MLLSELLSRYEYSYLPFIIDISRSKSCIRSLNAGLPVEVESITHQLLLHYRQVRRADGLSEASCNKEMAVLASALRWGNAEGIISHSVKIPRVREIPRTESLTEKQVQSLLNAAPNLKTKAYIALLFCTGQRKTAVAQLRRSQIIKGVIEFEQDGYEKAARRKRRARTPITAAIAGILKMLKDAFGDTEYVIPGQHGNGFCTHLDIWFREACKAARVKATPHVIRHTAATIGLEKGATIWEVSAMLGHSNTAITERVYLHRKPEQIKSVVTALGAAISL